jgi:hypothetical protein
VRVPPKNALVGKRIVAVDWGPFPDGKGGTAHRPVLTLDSGRVLRFVVEETTVGKYGVAISTREVKRSRSRGVRPS